MEDLGRLPDVPFTSQDAEQAGVSRGQLSRAVRQRQIRRLLVGVYAKSCLRDSIDLRCRAASLVISPNSVVRDRTAAWLHGVDVLDYPETEILPPIETAVLRYRTPTRRRGHRGNTRDLQPRDIQHRHGLFLTTPLRTALDLGTSLSPRSALAVLDEFSAKFLISREEMEREALRFARRRGVVQLRTLLTMVDPRAESAPESWTRYAIVDSGLPMPTTQHWVKIDGVDTYRLDLAYPRHKVAIEFDGEEFHDSPIDRERDEERRAVLRAMGWVVIVVRKHDFTPEAIERWTGEIRVALTARRRWGL